MPTSADALLYCYSARDRLTQLATKLRQHSPVEPEMPTITTADVIGGIKVRYV